MELALHYKNSEIGPIPDDWEYVLSGTFIDLLTGFPFPSKGYAKSGVRLLRGSNVKRGSTDWAEELTQFWPTVSNDIRKYLLKADDVVVAMDGSLVGRSFAMLSDEDVPSLLLQRVARIRSKTVAQKYIKAWFCSNRFTDHCDKVKTVTAIPHISPADIKSFALAVPPTKGEQHAIAEALSDADAYIQSLEQLLAKKRDLKQGAMQDLLTGKRRLPGFEVELGLRQARLGVLPKDWHVTSLGSVSRIKTGSRNNDDKVEDGKYPLFVRSRHVEKINTYSYDCEAILVPGEGDIGNIFHYVQGRFDVHQRVYAITQFAPNVCGRFVYYVMSQTFGAHAMQNSVKATVDSLRLPTFAKFEFGMPTKLAEQDAIVSVLGDLDAEMDSVHRKMSKARDLKVGMMQQLLTGRIRFA